MAQKSGGEISISWLGAWVFLIQLLVILVFVPNTWLSKVYEKETGMLEETFGFQTSTHIVDKGNAMYSTAFIYSGVNAQVYNFFFPSDADRRRSIGLENLGSNSWYPLINSMGITVKIVLILLFQRLSQILTWLPFFVMVLLPALWDGYMTWKLKYYSFRYASPWFHRFAMHSIKLLIISLLIGFFLPLPIHPMILPIMILLVVPTVTIALISNLPKKI
jgi:hypothetical protein